MCCQPAARLTNGITPDTVAVSVAVAVTVTVAVGVVVWVGHVLVGTAPTRTVATPQGVAASATDDPPDNFIAPVPTVAVCVTVAVHDQAHDRSGVAVTVGVNVAPVDSDRLGGSDTGTAAPESSSNAGDVNVTAYSPGDRTTTSRRTIDTVPEIVVPEARSNATARLPGAPVQVPVTAAPLTAHDVTSITDGS